MAFLKKVAQYAASQGPSTPAPTLPPRAPQPVGSTPPVRSQTYPEKIGAYAPSTGTNMPTQSPFHQSGKTLRSRDRATQAANDNATPAGGTQSGPGILENWFNQRANGTDPAYEYGTGRAADEINRNYAARGGYNSSAAMQSLSDMYSNSNAQRMGQLDQLAGGASGEHQRRLEDMFSQGQGIAGGQAGVAGAYDQSAGGAMADAYKTQMELMLGRAGVDQKTRQGELNTVTDIAGIPASYMGYNSKRTK